MCQVQELRPRWRQATCELAFVALALAAVAGCAALAGCAGSSSQSRSASEEGTQAVVHDSNEEPGHIAAAARLRAEVCLPMASEVCAARQRCTCAPPPDAPPCETTVLEACMAYGQRDHVAAEDPTLVPRYAYDEQRARVALARVRASIAACDTWNVDWSSPIVVAASPGQACSGRTIPLPPGVPVQIPDRSCLGGHCREGVCQADPTPAVCTGASDCAGSCVEGACYEAPSDASSSACGAATCRAEEVCMPEPSGASSDGSPGRCVPSVCLRRLTPDERFSRGGGWSFPYVW